MKLRNQPTSRPSTPASTIANAANASASASASAVLDSPEAETQEVDVNGVSGQEPAKGDVQAPAVENPGAVVFDVRDPVGTAMIHKPSGLGMTTVVNAQEIARQAVQRELDRQAEAARFDVYDRRVTIQLDADDLNILRTSWQVRNATNASHPQTFSQYLAHRLKVCRTHTSTRPVYVTDDTRQKIEALFGQLVTSDTDLLNQIDRTIRPIVESTGDRGPMRMPPVNPMLLEMVTGWEPDKTPSDALGEFMLTAALEKAGII